MKTLCLTLRETPEREAACRQHFAERGLGEVTYIYGIHAPNAGLLTKNNYEVDNPGSGHNIGPKGVGQWVSWLMLWNIALQMPDEHFFFVEHDAEFEPNWKARFNQGMKDVPKDFDLFFIGSCCLKSDYRKTPIKGEVWRVYTPNCGHAIVIAKKALPTIIQLVSRKCWAPLDIQLIFEVLPKLNVYAVLPRIVGQRDTFLHP